MEILYIQLEKLLAGFVDDILQPAITSEDRAQAKPSDSWQTDYWRYLEAFTTLKGEIETHPFKTIEDKQRQKQALAILRQTSISIFSKFALYD